MYIQFGQLALLPVPPVQDSLALLFEQQPGDRFLALFSVICVASNRNYSYPIWLQELFSRRLVAGRSDIHALQEHLHISNLRSVCEMSDTPLAALSRHPGSSVPTQPVVEDLRDGLVPRQKLLSGLCI